MDEEIGCIPALDFINLQPRIAMTFSPWIALALTVSLSTSPDMPTQSVEQLIQTGTAALKAARYEEAEVAWREVISRDPKNVSAYLQLGDSLRPRNLAAAKVAYEKAIELAPKQAEGYLRLAEITESFDRQIPIYRKAIAVAEPNAELYYTLGIRLLADPFDNRVFSEAEIQEAIDLFRKATQVQSQDKTYVAASYVVLGDRFLKGQAQIEAYQAAIDLNYLAGYMSYGKLLKQQNRLSEIVPLYEKAIRQNPNAPNLVGLHNLLAISLQELNRLPEAEAHYRKVIQLAPDQLYTYFTLGDVLKTQGKSDEAIHFYQQAAAIVRPDSLATPGSIFSYVQVGEQLQDRGLLDLAIETYKKIFDLDPKDHYVGYARIGGVLKMQGKQDEALKALRESVRLNPYGKSGKNLQQQGKLDEAEKALKFAIAQYTGLSSGLSDKNKILLAETQATTYQLLQKVLVLQNRTNEALEVAEQG